MDINFCRRLVNTPLPVDTAEQMRPLARYRISQAQNMLEKVQEPCNKLRDEDDPFYSKCCVDRLDEAMEFLEMAEKFFASGNYIAANNYALKALDLLQKIQECCTQ